MFSQNSYFCDLGISSMLHHPSASQINLSEILGEFPMGTKGSSGSRISRRWGVYLRRGCFSVKMYVKTKELGPIGEGMHPLRPPRSANERYNMIKDKQTDRQNHKKTIHISGQNQSRQQNFPT